MRRRALLAAAPGLRGLWAGPKPGAARGAIDDLTLDQAIARLWCDAARARFATTTDEERAAVAALVPALVAGRAIWAEPVEAARLRIERWRVAGRRFVVLRETVPRGAGCYAFPASDGGTQARAPFVLQAPHELFDIGTGALSARWFFGGLGGRDPVAFYTNTLHRYEDRPGLRAPHPNGPADVCHNARHLFTAATVAAVRAGAHGVLQIHGFGEPDADADTLAVVSAGRESGATPRARAVARALSDVLGRGVKLFPDDTRKLGATTNVQGAALARIPGADFVHVELAPTARDRLLREARTLAAFASALTRALT